MGRKTKSDLTVIQSLNQRPQPPSALSKRAAEVWIETVSPLQADYFRGEALNLLATYCSHIETFEYLTREIDKAMEESEDQRALKELLQMRKNESGSIKALATALRIAPSSSYNRKMIAKSHSDVKPWERKRASSE